MESRKITKIVLGTGLAILASGVAGCDDRKLEHYEKVRYVANTSEGKVEERISERGYEWLAQEGLPIEIAKKYDERFQEDPDLLLVLHEIGTDPGLANLFDKRFSAKDVVWFRRKGAYPARVNGFDERFKAEDIACFIEDGIESSNANAYPKRFDRYDIGVLKFNGIAPELCSQYDVRFNRFDIQTLAAENPKRVEPEIANGYSSCYNSREIRTFQAAEIDAQAANSWAHLKSDSRLNVSAEDIVGFCSGVYTRQEIENAARQVILEETLRR